MPEHLLPRIVQVTTYRLPSVILPVEIVVLTTLDTAEATHDDRPLELRSTGQNIARRAASAHCAGRPVEHFNPGRIASYTTDSAGHRLIRTQWRPTDHDPATVRQSAIANAAAITHRTYTLDQLDNHGAPLP